MVVGTGSLASAVAHAVAVLPGAALHVDIVGRRTGSADPLVAVARARAAAAGTRVTFASGTADLESGAVRPWDAGAAPELLLVAASDQSPWEATVRPSAWTDLVGRIGFGLTLPFQFQLAARLAAVAADDGVRLVNACLPDLVNPALDGHGLPVLTGAGNASTVHAFVEAHLGQSTRVLAHHYHLHQPADGIPDAWIEGGSPAGASLQAMRALPRTSLNAVTGLVTARLLRTLADPGQQWRTSLPGVGGRLGGLPVRIVEGGIEPDLPSSWSQEEVETANRGWSTADGALVEDGTVTFPTESQEELAVWTDEPLLHPVPIDQLTQLAGQLSQLRTTLRAQPSGAHG